MTRCSRGAGPGIGFNVIYLIRAIKCLDRPRTIQSEICSMDPCQSWQLVVFIDASLVNLERSGSIRGRVCFLVNSHGDVCPLSWQISEELLGPLCPQR